MAVELDKIYNRPDFKHTDGVRNDPDIGSKIRQRHRVGRIRISHTGCGEKFLRKIGEDYHNYLFFVRGRRRCFHFVGGESRRSTGVQAYLPICTWLKASQFCFWVDGSSYSNVISG